MNVACGGDTYLSLGAILLSVSLSALCWGVLVVVLRSTFRSVSTSDKKAPARYALLGADANERHCDEQQLGIEVTAPCRDVEPQSMLQSAIDQIEIDDDCQILLSSICALVPVGVDFSDIRERNAGLIRGFVRKLTGDDQKFRDTYFLGRRRKLLIPVRWDTYRRLYHTGLSESSMNKLILCAIHYSGLPVREAMNIFYLEYKKWPARTHELSQSAEEIGEKVVLEFNKLRPIN